MDTSLVIATFWFFLFIVIHFLFFMIIKIPVRISIIIRTFFVCIIASAVSIIIYFHLNNDFDIFYLVFNVFVCWLTMAALFVLYMPFYYTIATSISIQTLIFLLSHSNNMVESKNLYSRFANRKILIERLSIMDRNGYIQCTNEKYVLRSKGYFVASIFSKIKHVCCLGPGG